MQAPTVLTASTFFLPSFENVFLLFRFWFGSVLTSKTPSREAGGPRSFFVGLRIVVGGGPCLVSGSDIPVRLLVLVDFTTVKASGSGSRSRLIDFLVLLGLNCCGIIGTMSKSRGIDVGIGIGIG